MKSSQLAPPVDRWNLDISRLLAQLVRTAKCSLLLPAIEAGIVGTHDSNKGQCPGVRICRK
jgi:hypothetical protein